MSCLAKKLKLKLLAIYYKDLTSLTVLIYQISIATEDSNLYRSEWLALAAPHLCSLGP